MGFTERQGRHRSCVAQASGRSGSYFSLLCYIIQVKQTALIRNLNRIYNQGFASDFHEDFFSHSGFSNFGYWSEPCHHAQEASAALVHHLMAPVIQRGALQGPLLDVACGQGGTTRTLSAYLDPARITAINISQAQLEAAQKQAPGSHFQVMSATQLDFEAAHFEVLFCVEAVFHFETRRRFLREAFRVLQPGGFLVLTDVFFRWQPPVNIIPPANHIRSQSRYAELYLDAGFLRPEIQSVRPQTWAACGRALRQFAWRRLRQQPSVQNLRSWLSNHFRCSLYDQVIQDYLLVWAQKPE